DSVKLAATLFSPEGKAQGAVLIVPAMGVRQVFYAHFAAWLANQGFHVLTFDFRGIGSSLRGSLADEKADIMTWAKHDAAAALEYLSGVAGALPITWIGHSLGGQIVPFVPNNSRAKKIITVATGNGYWKHNAPQLRRK